MKLTGMDHVQLAMPKGREVEARQFYQEILGLTEVTKPEPLIARGGCWFEGPSIWLHLGVEPDFRASPKSHVAFLVKDLEESRQYLLDQDVRVVPDEALPDVRRFYAFDPFGNRLEFIQDGDGFSQK